MLVKVKFLENYGRHYRAGDEAVFDPFDGDELVGLGVAEVVEMVAEEPEKPKRSGGAKPSAKKERKP